MRNQQIIYHHWINFFKSHGIYLPNKSFAWICRCASLSSWADIDIEYQNSLIKLLTPLFPLERWWWWWWWWWTPRTINSNLLSIWFSIVNGWHVYRSNIRHRLSVNGWLIYGGWWLITSTTIGLLICPSMTNRSICYPIVSRNGIFK